MTTPVKQSQEQTVRPAADRIRARLLGEFVPLALEGLERMLLPDLSGFCEKVRRAVGNELTLIGRSQLYSAMSLVGVAMQERLGRTAGFPTDTVYDCLVNWVERDAKSGNAGLVLWALAIRKDPRAERIAEIITTSEEKRVGRLSGGNSMSMGWLLTGLSAAIREGIGGPRLKAVADRVCELLARNCDPTTGLFSLAGPGLRKNVLKHRMNTRLGSFASQVYPVVGLSHYSMASGNHECLQIAERTADAICRLQGPAGQWWWIYDVRTGEPVMRYPVYSVHQDAMGPMALLAVSLATGGKRDYSDAIWKSLDWLDRHPECPEKKLVDQDARIIWRAIQRDKPSRTGAFGLGFSERLRMNLSAWTGLPDRRPFRSGFVCDECRPYHLGWILVAAAMFEKLERAGK